MAEVVRIPRTIHHPPPGNSVRLPVQQRSYTEGLTEKLQILSALLVSIYGMSQGLFYARKLVESAVSHTNMEQNVQVAIKLVSDYSPISLLAIDKVGNTFSNVVAGLVVSTLVIKGSLIAYRGIKHIASP